MRRRFTPLATCLLLTLGLLACQQTAPGELDAANASSFTLIDAQTNQPITGFDPIMQGATLELSALPTRQLNVRANLAPTGSVRFTLNGQDVRTENVAPYALAGDTDGDYMDWTPQPGDYELTATPYSSENAGGEAGAPLKLSFKVVEAGSQPDPEQPAPTPSPTPTPTPTPTPSPAPEGCSVVALEAESLPLMGAWQVADDGAASGGKYITWTGLSREANNWEPADVVNVALEIQEAGSYRFTWAMRQPDDVAGDKANDSWLNFPDAARFGPVGGGSYGGFVKVFGNAKGGFNYQATADQDHQKSEMAIEFAEPGTYTMQLAGRSHGHQIDRIVVYRDSLSQEEAVRGDTCANPPANPDPTPPPSDPDPQPDPQPTPGDLGPELSYNCERIAWSSDGNQHDPDDIGASALALLLLAERGQQGRLAHYDHSSHLGDNNPSMEQQMIESVEGTAQRTGYDMSRIYNDQRDLSGSVNSIAQAINASSATNRLCFVVAGPHGVAYRGVAQADPSKFQHVTMISHSNWNDTHDDADNIYNLDDIKRDFPGLNFQAIRDQNGDNGLGTSVGEEAWAWMKSSDDAPTRWVGEIIDNANIRGDVSDSGMMWYVLQGDEYGNPAKFRDYLE